MSGAIPRGVLKHDAVPVDVLERPSIDVPIRIPRPYLTKARRDEPCTAPLPVVALRNVERQKVIAGRRLTDAVPALASELEVIRRASATQDDAVEPAMVDELAQHCEAKAVRIHPRDGLEIV